MEECIPEMDMNEFWEKGYLQEVNRQFFHPLGLALEMLIDKHTGRIECFGRIWDYRNDPEGMLFNNLEGEDIKQKAQFIKDQQEKFAKVREKEFGFIVQPIL